MSNITVLPEELSNRIAAGEVVERPASVVKELFENAVDANADVITVEIERAGSRLIRISDNGCGMDEADALLCFSPHATSKIKCAEDIDRIITLGFRGEALPSIASVAKVTLKTRQAAQSSGVEIVLEGGRVIDRRPAGMAPGTVMEVRDIFYNVPARKKFLRSPATEEAHIQEMVIALALGFPHISVTLKFDGKVALQAPGEKDPAARAAGLFGKNFAAKMLKVDHLSEDGIAVHGLIAMPGFSRTSRREQRTFVNGRAVESQALYRGIRDGYGTLADFGRFPPVVLNMILDASEYDINVHPTKREVRFKREYAVSRALTGALQRTLQAVPAPEMQLPAAKELAKAEVLLDAANIKYTPAPEAPSIPGLGKTAQMDIFRREPTMPMQEHIQESFTRQPFTAPDTTGDPDIIGAKRTYSSNLNTVKTTAKVDAIDAGTSAAEAAARGDDFPRNTLYVDRQAENPLPVSEKHAAVLPQSPLARELSDSDALQYIGILFETFILLESTISSTLYLVDFHAAHERVLYEELLAKATSAEQSTASQQLLFPLTVELSRTAAAFIGKNENIFAQLGFDAALLSSNTLLLSAVPANLDRDADWEEILSDLVNTALEGEKTTRDSLESIARAACHSAVKAHDPLNETTARALLKSMAKCQRPDVCPHGRPTVLKITNQELARRFGRI